MAAADYHLCDNCSAKTFYDADIDGFHDPAGEWRYGNEAYGGYLAFALCHKCEETHEIVIQRRGEPA